MKKTKGASEGGGTGDLGFGRGGSGDALIHSATRGMADTAASAGWMAATPCPSVQRLKEGRDGLGWYYSWWAKVHRRHSSFFVYQIFCLSFPFTSGTEMTLDLQDTAPIIQIQYFGCYTQGSILFGKSLYICLP